MSHQFSQPYRPAPVFYRTQRRRWPWLVALELLTVALTLAAFGVAGLAYNWSLGDAALAQAHDEGVDAGLQACGVVR